MESLSECKVKKVEDTTNLISMQFMAMMKSLLRLTVKYWKAASRSDSAKCWMAIHEDELMANWKMLSAGEGYFKIETLK